MSSLKGSDLGNKPLIVVISLVASIFTIVAFFSGKQSIQEFASQPTSISGSPVTLTSASAPAEVRPVEFSTPTSKSPTAVVDPQNGLNNYAQISDEVPEINLRRSPGYLDKNDSTDVVVKIPTGALVNIIGGPVYRDNLNWWRISWQGYEGWIADHTGNGRTIMVFNP